MDGVPIYIQMEKNMKASFQMILFTNMDDIGNKPLFFIKN